MYGRAVGTQSLIRRLLRGATHPLALVALVALGGCNRASASQAQVTCHTSRDGIACDVSSGQGVTANVCWDLAVLCRNRTRGTAHACQVVSFGRRATRTVPMSAVQMPDTCDAVLTVDVDHVVASE